MDQTSNHLKVLITVAAIVGGIIVKGWIWKKRSSSSDKSAVGNRDLSSNRRQSCTPPLGQDYEVFLSFRGEDTRKEFTDHLYSRINDAGVWVFRDNEELQVGEELGPELMKAIKASKISIPIISRNYASSAWCLRELVQILECKKTGQKVLPIFYKVTPRDVRNQMGEFKNAFNLHQKKYASNQIQEWRNALTEVASLKGLESDKIADWHEGELVKIILAKVIKKLKKANLVVGDYLVGVQDHVEKIKKMADTIPSNEVQVILFHGMGGIGKTTLAKLIYNQFSTQYEHRSFLPNVRERSLGDRGKVDLQKQLISDVFGKMAAESVSCTDAGINVIRERFKGKKVLILLDDVNHRDQLNALARESDWFAPGSKIIVTSRNSDILAKWKNRLTYELNELDAQRSFQLFCFHAFGRDVTPRGELKSIAEEIVSITGGLPLAIEVIGSLLFAKSQDCWEDNLKILKEIPIEEVMDILRISYNSLKYEEQQIFLDIACFSFEARKEFSCYMWDACGFHPRERVRNLISLSLIKIGDWDELIMHDQLKDLGSAIVRETSFSDLGKRSRLWIPKEAEEVLIEHQGTEEVEAISLLLHEKYEEHEEYCLTREHFKDLIKLRLLVLGGVCLHGDFNNLLTNLKWLRWEGTPFKHFKTMPTNFHPKKLVVLELIWLGSLIEHWSLWSQVEVVKKLKAVRIEGCALTTMPDFSAFEELKILILCNCHSLIEIHPSIHSVCGTLTVLDVSGNTKLSKLPDSIGSLVNLHTLSLRGCYSLKKIPPSIGHLGALSALDLEGTRIAELPESIGDLHNLEELNISNTRIERLTPAIGKLRKLQRLHAEGIETLKEFPEIGGLTSLQHLSLWRCPIRIPDLPCGLTSLYISGDSMEELPSFSNLTNLKVLKYEDKFWKGNKALDIGKLINLETLQINTEWEDLTFDGPTGSLLLELPPSLVILNIFYCPALSSLLNLSNSKHLTQLTLRNCRELRNVNGLEGAKKIKEIIIEECTNLVEIQWLDSMESLEELKIRHCSSLERIGDLSRLNMLKVLELKRLELSAVEGIDQLTTIEELKLCYLPRLKTIGDLSNMKKMKRSEFLTCDMPCSVEGTGQLTTLERMYISDCPCLESIGDLSYMKKLKELTFSTCDMLCVVEGIGQLTSLEMIDIFSCPCLDSIGDLSNMKKLKNLTFSMCDMLRVVDGISQLTSLEEIYIIDCPCLESIGDLSHLKMLERLSIKTLSGVEGIGQLRSLKDLRISSCQSFERIEDLSHLEKLKELELFSCENLSGVEGISQLTSLEKLVIDDCPCLESIGDLSYLKQLKELLLIDCGKLGVEGIRQLTSLETLVIRHGPSLESIGDLSHWKELKNLELYNCEDLNGVEGICQLTSLETLVINECLCLESISDLSHFKELKKLELYECKKLSGVEGICQLTSLETLVIKKCPCLEIIGDLSQLKELKKLKLYGCEKLSGVEGICQLTSLETLAIENCPRLESIGEPSHLKKLKNLELW